VDPRLYTDEPRHPRTDEPDEVQDAADVAAANAVISVGLPTLAICRGFQVVNVALGGTLVQHLEPDPIDHANNELHEVDLEPGSRVATAMGSTVVFVSSYHHQAVARVGADLVVVGRARDGCVEAFEHATAPLMAVQWHPEDNAHEADEQQALFDSLVEQARAFKTQRMAT
jgi:putative glutamine amidotransferase